MPLVAEPSNTVEGELSAALVATAEAFAKNAGLRIEVVYLAAYVALLGRVTESREFMMHADGVAHLPLPASVTFVAELPGEITFRQVLLQVATRTSEFEGRSGAAARAGAQSFSFEFNTVEERDDPARYSELRLAVRSGAGGTRCVFSFDPAVYTASVARRYFGMMSMLLETAIGEPDRLIDELPLMTVEEREAVLARGCGPEKDWGPWEPVHALVERLALRTPGNIAVECDGSTYTARQLYDRVGEIAAQLVAAGAQPLDRIALSMARSMDMLATVLAILRIGCAYVPLDTRYPEDRVRVAVTDSEARLLVTDGSVALPAELPVLTLQAGAGGAVPAAYTSAPEDEAYVIYTSGSTGKPKGVAIPHRALRNFLYAVEGRLGLTSSDVIVAITTISFDIATLETLLAVMLRARLVIATDEEARTPGLLLPLLKRVSATALQATPGVWRALIDEGWKGDPRVTVMSGGEAMSRDLADKLIARSDRVWNMYGPTETTIYSSMAQVTPGNEAPPVDAIYENIQYYIVDRFGALLPPTVSGELYIGGDCLANGYVNRPELTAEKFITNPFGPGRMYNSGDLAEWDDDGRMRLLGRSDFQVKVSGYRIETGEIEHVMVQHPAVREAVVVAHKLPDTADRAGITRLVGYVDVTAPLDASISAQLVRDLNDLLHKAVPPYMVPAAIVPLEGLPRLINGKVNRKGLPDVFQEAGDAGVGGATSAVTFQEPRDFLERQLSQIWQATLGIPRISTGANFFSLGVGSLAALRMVTRVNRAFAMDFGLATLLTSPTIVAMATLIRNRHESSVESSLVPIQAGGTRPPLYILHGVGGNILTFLGLAKRLGDDQSVYAIQSQALLTGRPALLHIEDMAGFYIREIKTVQPEGPYQLMGYSFGGTLAAEMATQLRAAGERVSLLAMLDSHTLEYDAEFQAGMNAATVANRRVQRFTGNTRSLSLKDKVAYVSKKLATRSVRMMCLASIAAGRKTLPSVFKSAWDINLVAMHTYKLKQYEDRLVLFRASDQVYTDGPRDLGWSKHFAQTIEIHEVEGDHERIFLEPAVEELAARIRAALDRAQAGTTA